eukprot:7470353-Pyramimonas_sp.AAC.1
MLVIARMTMDMMRVGRMELEVEALPEEYGEDREEEKPQPENLRQALHWVAHTVLYIVRFSTGFPVRFARGFCMNFSTGFTDSPRGCP